MRVTVASIAILLLTAAHAGAQYYQTDFPAEEFRARHARVFEQIGANAVAVVQGVAQTEGFTLPRQHNTFYYLSGIETPGAYLLLDGRTKEVTLYLPATDEAAWGHQNSVVARGADGAMTVTTAPLPSMPDELRGLLGLDH